MNRIIPYLLISTAFLSFVHANDRHMICKDVEDVFDERPSGSRHVTRPLPGKRGPPGPKGEVDYSIINETIKKLVNAKIQEYLGGNQATVTEQRTVCMMKSARVYKNKCYWFVLKTNDVGFSEARNLCSEAGGEPADVLSQAHYDMIGEMFRAQSTERKWFWTGMTIDPAINVTKTSDGRKAKFVKWYSSSYPSTNSGNDRILIQMEGGTSGNQGMYNRRASNSAYGALCQL